MATRVVSRRALREQNDQLEQTEQSDRTPDEDDEPATRFRRAEHDKTGEGKVKKPRSRKAAAKPAKEKAPPKPRVRKRAVKVPPRMFARWAVCDNALKRVAVFEYRDRDGADAKLAEMLERKPGAFFLQLIKVPLDPPAPVEADPVAAV